MKKIFKYTMMLATAALVMVSCKDDDNISKGEWNAKPDYQDVAFEKESFSEELDPDDPKTTTAHLIRNTKSGEAVVPVKILQNTDDVFTVEEIRFADGDSVANVVINFDKAEVGKPYTLELFIDDPAFASNYSTNTTFTYTVTRVKWNPAGYVEIAGQRYDGYAMYTDDFVGPLFGAAPISYPVELQERDDHPGIFRMVNAYSEAFPRNNPGDWDDTKDYYITINAEDPEHVFLDPYDIDLGLAWGNYGMFFIRHLGGYYHARNNENSAESYYGKYENGVITFPEKSFYCGMANYEDGAFIAYGNGNNAFRLVIDPSKDLYYPDIEEDYNYTDVWTGAFSSGKTGETSNVLLQVGALKEDIAALAEENRLAELVGTPYRWVGPYADGYDLYFYVNDEGVVVVPEGYELQPIGRTDNLGTEIYAKISGGASSFSPNEVILSMTFCDVTEELVYGTGYEQLANITYTPYATGTVYYNFWTNGVITEDPGYTLSQRDDKPEIFMIEEWGYNNFLFSWNQSTNACEVLEQYTGYDDPSYGPMYIIEGAKYHSDFAEKTSYYDPETKTFHFFPAYIVAAGSYGQREELFVITDEGEVKHHSTFKLKNITPVSMDSNITIWGALKNSKSAKMHTTFSKKILKKASLFK